MKPVNALRIEQCLGATHVTTAVTNPADESLGIEVDPQNQRLKRIPTVRLKSLR
jgi:hypothetical protein